MPVRSGFSLKKFFFIIRFNILGPETKIEFTIIIKINNIRHFYLIQKNQNRLGIYRFFVLFDQ